MRSFRIGFALNRTEFSLTVGFNCGDAELLRARKNGCFNSATIALGLFSYKINTYI